jgi:hypothetical protein
LCNAVNSRQLNLTTRIETMPDRSAISRFDSYHAPHSLLCRPERDEYRHIGQSPTSHRRKSIMSIYAALASFAAASAFQTAAPARTEQVAPAARDVRPS